MAGADGDAGIIGIAYGQIGPERVTEGQNRRRFLQSLHAAQSQRRQRSRARHLKQGQVHLGV